MSTQPEALFLADALEGRATRAWTREEAAAELRRLHDHTQMLEHAYKSACDIVKEQDKKLVDLEAVNQELLEAIYEAQRQLINLLPIIGNGLLTDRQLAAIDPHIDMALQALDSAEGEQK
jgi:hypothetical protein